MQLPRPTVCPWEQLAGASQGTEAVLVLPSLGTVTAFPPSPLGPAVASAPSPCACNPVWSDCYPFLESPRVWEPDGDKEPHENAFTVLSQAGGWQRGSKAHEGLGSEKAAKTLLFPGKGGSEPAHLGFGPSSSSYQLCDLVQVICPL